MRVDPQVTGNYASALLAAVKKAGNGEQAMEDAAAVVEVFSGNPRLRAFLESPSIPDAEKQALIEKLFRNRVQPLIANFMLLVLRRRRLENLVSSLEEFNRLLLEDMGIKQAEVTTAIELSYADKQLVQATMEKRTGYKLRIAWKVDATIIGGVRFQCGDLLIDDTLRSGLDRLRRRMLTARVA